MDTSLYILHAVTKWKNSVSSNIRRGEGQQQGSFCVFFLAVFCLFGWTTRKIIVWRNKEVKWMLIFRGERNMNCCIFILLWFVMEFVIFFVASLHSFPMRLCVNSLCVEVDLFKRWATFIVRNLWTTYILTLKN